MLDKLNTTPLEGIRIVSFGEVLFDIIDNEPHLGGAPLNFAWYASQMGAEVALLSAVGNDLLGNRALNTCLLYTSPSPRDLSTSRMPSSA